MAQNSGREARRPGEIPRSGLKDVAKRVKNQIGKDHIGIISAGVAFYFFLALFPAITAIISIYGLVNDPAQVEQQMSQLGTALPSETHQMLYNRLEDLTRTPEQTLGWGVALSILLSLWSANKGTKALFEGVNIAYNEQNSRNFFQENGLTLLFTISGMVIGIICMSLVMAFPALFEKLTLPGTLQTIISWGRWLLLAIVVALVLTMIYRYAPDRGKSQFQWISWGAVISTLLWIIGSWAISYYVNNFDSYDRMYGSVAAVIILMLWFYLTGFVILLGAEINAELEHQTTNDTTKGKPKPIGKRNAWHADHVAGEPYKYEEERSGSR